MARGRIADADRPVINWDEIETEEIERARGRTLGDLDPHIKDLVERAYDTGREIVATVTSQDVGAEICREVRAYARLREPELSVGAKTVQRTGPGGKAVWRVIITARDKIRRKSVTA